MTLKSADYYWVECDGCGRRFDDYLGEYAAMEYADTAVDLAVDAGWTTDGLQHHCQDCTTLATCEECDAPIEDPLAGERSYMCRACWEREQPSVEAQP